jgi:hypothetical protein
MAAPPFPLSSVQPDVLPLRELLPPLLMSDTGGGGMPGSLPALCLRGACDARLLFANTGHTGRCFSLACSTGKEVSRSSHDESRQDAKRCQEGVAKIQGCVHITTPEFLLPTLGINLEIQFNN